MSFRPGIFDAHCDTLVRKATGSDFIEGSDRIMVDLPGLLESGVRHQVMAVCVEAHPGMESVTWERALSNYAMLKVTEKPVFFFALEGCLPIWEGWELPEKPLVASLTWNGDSPYGGGIGSVLGLSDQGYDLVRELHRQGTALDVSHLNDRTRADLLRKDLPLCATHCNARRLCEGRGRNLPDHDLRAIAASGGVTGVTFVPDFLEEDGSKATVESIVNHVEYIAELTSVDSVGFGSDFDGVQTLPPGITGAVSWGRVIDALENRGWPREDIEKVAGGNWRRFFELENHRRNQ